ncbi:helix-turn-helix domain-containing protein [Streptomyces sp. NBC_01604]|uniref:helix-turn-helix domain-containing protein n=1 Tax=Streptomyces sp. NBC_01604 TaxID=2975894 RepID=UPI003863797D
MRDRRPGAGPPYEQRHRGDQRGGGDRRPERGSRCQQHSLAQRFKELIGVTPKRLARSYRFAATVLSINPAGPIDWADLAAGAGYFDQAHFGHEFRAFTGLTPTRYVEIRRRFLREHPGHVLDSWPLPAD